jgi:hypothetical protein
MQNVADYWASCAYLCQLHAFLPSVAFSLSLFLKTRIGDFRASKSRIKSIFSFWSSQPQSRIELTPDSKHSVYANPIPGLQQILIFDPSRPGRKVAHDAL